MFTLTKFEVVHDRCAMKIVLYHFSVTCCVGMLTTKPDIRAHTKRHRQKGTRHKAAGHKRADITEQRRKGSVQGHNYKCLIIID